MTTTTTDWDTFREMFTQAELPTCWTRLTRDDASRITNDADALKWSAPFDPPAIGSRVWVTINNCGPATVVGYFVQDGYLGCITDLLDAPEWHRKQNKGNPRGHSFGAEMTRGVTRDHGYPILATRWARLTNRRFILAHREGNDFHPFAVWHQYEDGSCEGGGYYATRAEADADLATRI